MAIGALGAILTVGFYEGRKAYWDYRVRELCHQDGGVRILQKLVVTKAETEFLPQVANGRLGVTTEQLADPRAPAFAERRVTEIRDWNPSVEKVQWIIMRRSDRQVFATLTFYSRVGGDMPTGILPGSSYRCPDANSLDIDLQSLFVVKGESR